jgi:hypothetical protein
MRLGLGFQRPAGEAAYIAQAQRRPQRSDGNDQMERAAGDQQLSCRAAAHSSCRSPGRPISRVVPRAVPRAEFEAQALAQAGH